jgi:uncharacterized membrane protein
MLSRSASVVAVARSRSKVLRRFLTLAAVALTIVSAALAAVGTGTHFDRVSGTDSSTIPGASLRRGELRFFSYRDDAGKEIRFILGRDEAGHVQGAFDACQECARYGKGYTTSHGYLMCRFCGNRYKLNLSNSGIASCAPIKLQVREAGGAVVVDTSQLEQHQKLF